MSESTPSEPTQPGSAVAAYAVAAIGLISMAAALVYGFGWGNGWAEVSELVTYPWFNVSLVDVYVGFVLFAGWVVARERRLLVAAAWIVMILVLGNLITCLYVLIALGTCGRSRARFWLGARGA